MKKMLKATTFAVLVLVGTVARAEDEDRSRDVVRVVESSPVRGAWKISLKPGEGGPPPFVVLMVINRDGGVVETDAGPPNPLLFSPGVGEWTRKDNGHYLITYTQMEFAEDGVHTGMFDALLDVTISDNNEVMTGTARVRFFTLEDVLLFEADGTIEGKRLMVK